MKRGDSAHIPGAFPLTDVVHLPVTGDEHPLRREFARWLSWSNGAALLAGLLVFAIWFFMNRSRPEQTATYREVRIARYTELGVPPSISRAASAAAPPQISIARAVAPPAIGIPEPVPDIEVPETQTIATQEEMAGEPGPVGDLGGTGTGDSLVVGGGGGGGGEGEGVDLEPSPDEFIAVEVEPVRISIARPVYPDVAKSAGVEGTVIVRALVGKDGKVKKCIIVDGQAMLNDAAVVCARTALFKPALVQNKPVEVWVMMPILFKMH